MTGWHNDRVYSACGTLVTDDGKLSSTVKRRRGIRARLGCALHPACCSPASDMPDSIAVVLPAYNEEITIRDVILDFHRSLPEASIYVIDNRSSDRTQEIARATFAEFGVRGEVLFEPRPGKGSAVRYAFHYIDADFYLLADADLTYPAARARDMLKPVQDGTADMVVGDRLSAGHYDNENKRAFHGFGNRLVCWLVNTFFRASLADILSGYRAFNRQFVKNYAVMVDGFQIETDVTLHALDKRFRIREIPVEYVDRPAGSFSKLNTFSDGMRVISTIVQILRYFKPFVFFGTLALVFSLAGFLAAIPVLKDWFLFKYIYHVPLAVLAASLQLFAVILLAIALILDNLNQQERVRYELRLLSMSGR